LQKPRTKPQILLTIPLYRFPYLVFSERVDIPDKMPGVLETATDRTANFVNHPAVFHIAVIFKISLWAGFAFNLPEQLIETHSICKFCYPFRSTKQ